MKKSTMDPALEVRRSQLITPYSVGALADINNQSVMVIGPEKWNSSEQFHDIRLERAMKANCFIQPPLKENGYVPVKRFPNWFFSPKTKKLKRFEDWKNSIKYSVPPMFYKKPFEFFNSEKIELVPVRFICACRNGHIQDFPWFEWAHMDMDGETTSSSNTNSRKHELSLISLGSSDSISSIVVECSCGCKRSLRGIFNTDGSFAKALEKIDVKCHGDFFWDQEIDENEECNEPLHALLRNATNLYFPNIVSSVNIPFSENKNIEKIKDLPIYLTLESLAKSHGISLTEELLKKDNSELIALLARETSLTSEQVIRAVTDDQAQIQVGDEMTVEDYRFDEYQVLMGKKDFDKSEGRLKISDCRFKDSDFGGLEKKIGKLTLVNQLEVVNVLKSYSRIEPTDSEQMIELRNEEEPNSSHNVSEISLRNGINNSFIGLEMLGEGIFINLDEKELNNWIEKISQSKIEQKLIRKIKKGIHEDEVKFINPVFYMIHTLSHLLIRELNAYCGYSSSALKERIYFSEKKGKGMAGILIYTSSSDSEGTLGGLVKQGTPKMFFKILGLAIEKARWCSYDPVCLESDSQGRDSLNSAACHACTLISETSCDKMNSFLDRTVLIGSTEEKNLGYFS